jgi:hypothetical protein
MAFAVRVRATVTGQRRRSLDEHELQLDLPPQSATAHALIAAVVRSEVAAYEQRADESEFVRVLTAASLAEGLQSGAVRLGDVERPAVVDVAAAVETAQLAFDDGIFKVFVGDDEVGPEEVVSIAEGAQLLFLRLVPLAGG